MQTPIPNLSEDLLARASSEQSYERGQEYYLAGAVWNVIRRGGKIVAQVEGSQYEPYTVSIDFDQEGLADATCNCPYDWGGWCKHIVATLLVCLPKPGQIESKPSIGELLAGLDADQLRALLTRLVEGDARLIDSIEHEVALFAASAVPSRPGRATLDQAPIRRRVSATLHSLDHMRRSEAYWHVASVVDRVRQMLARVQDWIAAGDTANAFAFLEAITDAYVEEWVILDDSDGEPSGFSSTWAMPGRQRLLMPTCRPLNASSGLKSSPTGRSSSAITNWTTRLSSPGWLLWGKTVSRRKR